VFTGNLPRWNILPTPPPTGTVQRWLLSAFQLAVMIGALVRYPICASASRYQAFDSRAAQSCERAPMARCEIFRAGQRLDLVLPLPLALSDYLTGNTGGGPSNVAGFSSAVASSGTGA
jgi:hypothetical protein